METTYDETKRLLQIEKRVRDASGVDTGIVNLDPSRLGELRFDLVSVGTERLVFQWCIYRSAKDTLKMSLHLMDGPSKEGLLRVDYNAAHMNPREVLPSLPGIFVPYAGRSFPMDECHVHYQVEGYKNLVWALPAEIAGISKLELRAQSAPRDIEDAILSFAEFVSITTKFNILQAIL